MRTHLCFYTFFIPFCLFLLNVSGQCQDDQRSLLIQLKDSLQFGRIVSSSTISNKLASWNTNGTTDCCTWGGVTCSSSGQVIGLDLSNEAILGGIDDSSVLFNLTNLQSLNLAANNFNFAQIPSRFAGFASLLNLNLSNSGFSGQIPGELSQLTSLQSLDLSSLFSYGTRSLKLETPNLTTLVQNLTRLRYLYLDNVNISSQKFDWSQGLSASLPNLEVLSLSNCQLSGPLDDSLGELQSLSIIRLALNKLNSPVPEFFTNFKNLTVMNLASCNLTGTFPKKVLQLESLQILDLSVNTNLYGSLPDFPINGSLQSLVLSNTNFSGEIPQSIGNLKNLSRIELHTTNFNGGIRKSMENLTQLSYLDLSSNKFIGEIPSFKLCKNLTHIDLSRNGLSGMIPSDHFQDLNNLISVDLGFNSFNGSIPSSLFSLQLLQQIKVSNNKFEGHLPNFSSPSLFSLDTLDLSGNKLEGEIPKSFFELRKLSILVLSSNNLSGILRTVDFQDRVSNLTTLDLSFNNFTIMTSDNLTLVSSLPKFFSLKLASCNLKKFPNLRNQTRLITLDLSDNKIEGEIPNWIWEVGNGSLSYMNLSRNNLTSLQEPYKFPNFSVLDLHFNNLSGAIPIPPQTATFVDYSQNLFSSSIPESIGRNLTVAYFFSVSNNLLTGRIPDSICNATYLRVLDLSRNRLTGRVPKCLIEFGGSLGVLNLANNRLTDQPEGTFPSTCGLNTLDLHGNSMEGKISRSIVNCAMLEVLNIGNNRMNDTYPCYLGNLTNLRVLVLRNNSFHGPVQCPQSHHNNWPKLQIVDIACNEFSGPVPEKCFLQWGAMMTDERSSTKHLSFRVLQLNDFYYQDTVTVTVKGFEVELVKILTIFTSIDISSNRFSGVIPETIGQLKALFLFNVSHNELRGSIPQSMGNLSQLESLDMSWNKLTGNIPSSLSSLNFLSTLNLSYNQLEGRIPVSTQLQSFEKYSFTGNKGLCGPPLNRTCGSSKLPTQKGETNSQESKTGYDWQFIFTGVGFGSGAAIIMVPLMLSKTGRRLWDNYTNNLVKMICLVLGIHYASCSLLNEHEDDEKEKLYQDDDTDESDFESEVDPSKGRYCVFCTKIDFYRKQVIHDTKCTCFAHPKRSSTSSSNSSSEAQSPFSKL
ncbi:Leucine-rich repeat-containing protein [Artemisia annua]|uniref:Leucine-rich repeat-containing protein n=1 Tax=Artemisia annua TaxID=35608 RepID=A0A2U1Q0K0_ARTAN|nr:Leucine-rich repeat-containing protein [Artemisia annua]